MTARFKSLALILSTIFVVAGIPESNAQNKIGKKNTCSEARDEGRLISLYDGSFAAIDPDPQSPLPAKEDPLLIQLNTLLTAGMNSYVREQLKFETDISYEVLNKEVSQKWNWKLGLKLQQGFVGVAESLKSSMSMNKDLKAFIAHRVFDLITPYFGSVIITGQMSLDPAITSNLTLKVYEGGQCSTLTLRAEKCSLKMQDAFFSRPWTRLHRKCRFH